MATLRPRRRADPGAGRPGRAAVDLADHGVSALGGLAEVKA
ncbi:hypothetical protein V2I01_02415 [Micromonospora sp. BRA006-A]|nr:hypothetical protein [Micromonospora sp. BRA006-A]